MDKYDLKCPYYLVFVNGEYQSSHLPDDVQWNQKSLIFSNKEPLDIQIIYDMNQEKEFIIEYSFDKYAEVHLIETKILNGNATLHKKVYLNEGAIVHLFSENRSAQSKNTFNDEVYLSRDALIQTGYAEFGNDHVKGTFCYYLEGENAHAKVRMAALSQNKEKKTYKVAIEHRCHHTFGQMDNYGVVKDQASLIIDGIGRIQKGHHGSQSHQTNKIMVFDPRCIASANPYLYIDEYDVKASHAAAVGKMDEEHLYYLQSRGLSKHQAMQLITYGYLKPVVEVIDNEMLKESFEDVLSKVGA